MECEYVKNMYYNFVTEIIYKSCTLYIQIYNIC